MTRNRRVALATAVLVVACGRSGDGGRVGAGAATPAWDIAASGPDDSVRFTRIASAAMLPGGTVALADASEQSVLIFDRTGRLVHRVGRPGDGPGEFRSIHWIGRCGGDSLYVWDVGTTRVTVLDSAGRPAREFRAPPGTWKMACNGRGELVTVASPPFQAPSANAPELFSTVLLLAPTGDTVARIDSVPVGRNRPMAALTDIARTRDRVLLGIGDSAVVETFSATGARVAVLPLAIPPRTPTAADYDAAIDSVYFAPIPAGPVRDRLRRAIATIPMPDHPAVYHQLFADSAGNAWAATLWPLDSVETIYGVAPDGTELGPVRLRRGLRLLDVAPGRILGWYLDAEGTEHLAMYRFPVRQ